MSQSQIRPRLRAAQGPQPYCRRHFTRPGSDGRFRLTDVPAGKGDLVVWHDRATPWQSQVEAGRQQAPVEVHLELKHKRIPPHMNKFGKPYGRSRDGAY